ncbi:hypothetical protein ZIOFF_052591 [Zingiber officinale]|uniref:Uncharacterized protein n=1 Tax=Zingiber officinale TaxID=94328 RepID=A0A8J5KSL2_ZINOF|nr:hypothetical protein ZIOFF_052591 [Zingiber officinale]
MRGRSMANRSSPAARQQPMGPSSPTGTLLFIFVLFHALTLLHSYDGLGDGVDGSVPMDRRKKEMVSASRWKASNKDASGDTGSSESEEVGLGSFQPMLNTISITSLPSRQKERLRGKVAEENDAVDLALVPRKLRSAMNKRSRGPLSLTIPNAKKKHYRTSNRLQGLPNSGGREGKQNGLLEAFTKDEELVIEALCELSRMLPIGEQIAYKEDSKALDRHQVYLANCSKGSKVDKNLLHQSLPNENTSSCMEKPLEDAKNEVHAPEQSMEVGQRETVDSDLNITPELLSSSTTPSATSQGSSASLPLPIATLLICSLDSRADAAASLVSLARDNERYGKLIIEEDGVGPLLRLIKEGHLEGQESAAHAIGLLARYPDSVEAMVLAGVCSTFAKVLKEGPMKVQAMVAWSLSELAASHPKCQDVFAQNNVVRLLVGHLAFETVQEHSKYTIPSKGLSIHSVVMANSTTSTAVSSDPIAAVPDTSEQPVVQHPAASQLQRANQNQMHSVIQSTMTTKTNKLPTNSNTHNLPAAGNGKHHPVSLAGASIKGREFEDPATKAYMKAMAAKALCQLCKGNPSVCKSVTESRALLCFSVLIEKSTDEVQYNSAMALMEICRVAEQDSDLRRSAFKPSSPAARAVVDQLLRIVHKADDDLLVPCIVALGCLSRTFRATETRIIAPLVKLLDETESIVSKEAAIALTKFACSDNYLHLDHSKAIIKTGGTKHLVQLVYWRAFGPDCSTDIVVLHRPPCP